ncbi:hypothetical protein [Embleya sp. NPDC059259]|uniref:hypothetical protein n=1 Tax=unclassified Embleya TaxID=2699296 RepID=UPI0036AE2E1A
MRDWAPAGIEGLMIKDARQRHLPGERRWRKYRSRDTTEALVGAVAGSLRRPTTVLFGRYHDTGRLRLVGRSSTLNRDVTATLAARLAPADADHPGMGAPSPPPGAPGNGTR